MNQDDEGKHMPRFESHCGYRLWSADYLDFRRSSMSLQGSVPLPVCRPVPAVCAAMRSSMFEQGFYVLSTAVMTPSRCGVTVGASAHQLSLQSSLGEQLSAYLKFVFTGQNNFCPLVTIIIKKDELYNLVFFALKLLYSLPASSLQCHMTKFLCAG